LLGWVRADPAAVPMNADAAPERIRIVSPPDRQDCWIGHPVGEALVNWRVSVDFRVYVFRLEWAVRAFLGVRW